MTEVGGIQAERSTAGYSGTPLPRKLGITAGATVSLVDAPPDFRTDVLVPLPAGVMFKRLGGHREVVVFFTTRRRRLEQRIERLGEVIRPDGMLWIAWPKRASKVPTDMTEDVVRDVALALGLVDTKVAAIDDVWSGLRLVWRRELR